MNYLIKVLYKDYEHKQVSLIGTIPTNIRMDSQTCLLRARKEFGGLVKDEKAIIAYQERRVE